MKRTMLMLALVATMALVLFACKSDEQGATQGEGVITGVVTDAATGNALASVTLQAQTIGGATQTATTDAQGNFRFSFTTDSAKSVTISVTKSGYRDTSVVVQIQPGVVVTLGLQIAARSPISGVGGGSGVAQTIAFLGASPRQISVYGVGGLETSILGFEVRDSLGLAIDAAHSVSMSFQIVGGLNGGEYISPLSVTTNAIGQAYTTFNSGIRAGVFQVVATVTLAGRPPITSNPVRLIITAGFPDQAHFTIGIDRFNFPALGIVGKRNSVSVLVGDKYTNPVQPNTAVYFRSSAGVIQPSVFTDASGQGTVDLISGNPAPFGIYAARPPYGPDTAGYHHIVARTVGEGGVTVQDSTLILWSGGSIISNVNPTTFNIPDGGFQDFTFTVSDFLGHPLSEGTIISVQATVPPPPDPNAQVNQVQLAFGRNGSLTLPDVILPGPGRTAFGFRLSDGSTIVAVTPVTVSITVTSENNNAYFTFFGIVN
ncbi:MAG TPA: carboxypeptidase regulatory-like domain-containing protein [Bacteroidota bacterium]|nr:carboxypeptidase regulatory-like domain-containing protein [Bacteroidota bacterium]